MAIKGKQLTVNFLVWDTVNNCGKTGDANNITLRIIRDGTVLTVNAGRVSHVNSSSTPGIYQITLTAQEMSGDFICVSGISSTAGVVVYPAFVQTERGDLEEIKNLLGNIPVIPDNIATKADVTAVSNAVAQLAVTVNAVSVMIQNFSQSMAEVPGKVNAIDTALNQQGGVSDSIGNILSGVNNINNGVKLNSNGKDDVEDAVKTGIAKVKLSEPGEIPCAINPAMTDALMLLYMALRNKSENTKTDAKIFKSNNRDVFAAYALDDINDKFTKSELKEFHQSF